MADSKPRPDASASAASTDSDAKADPKSVAGVEEPASKPEETAPEQAADNSEDKPAEAAPEGDDSAKAADKPEAAPADTGDAEPAPQVPAEETIIAPQPTQAPFAPVGDDDSDENITTIGNRIFGRR